jgi:hypothetical protein
MKRKTARELEEINAIEEAIRIEAEREAERVRRETEAREHAPWQDEAWSEANDSDGIGLEVEWSESEE